VEDYDHLAREFGIELFDPLLPEVPNPNMLMRRGLIFGHRDFERVLEAMKNRKEFAVLSGIKPTGQFHLGTLTTAKEIVYFQNQGATTFYCIADVEAYEDNRIPFRRSEKYAVDNVADILALGLDPEKAYIYRQSQETRVKDLAILFGRAVTLSTAKAIYGERHIGLYLSALIQAGDILLPQLEDFGGPKPTVVPVGVDQDPHLRLTRDLTQKFRRSHGFILPSATYHKLIKSLSGASKMSKRESGAPLLTLNDKPAIIAEKISNAFTGGRATIAEQKKLGGVPEVCPIYDLCKFHFVQKDDDVAQIYRECKSGDLLCGEHKKSMIELVTRFAEQHQRERSGFIDKAKEILGLSES
jgi:tryptophanyl-tRNA synthetase